MSDELRDVVAAIGLAFGVAGYAFGLNAYITARRARQDVQQLARTLLGLDRDRDHDPGEHSEGSTDAF